MPTPTNESDYGRYLRELTDYWRQYDAATGELRVTLAAVIELHIRANERRAVLRELQDFHDKRNQSHG